MAITPNYDLDVDTSLGGSSASDYVIPSQKAIKAYVDNNSGAPIPPIAYGTSTTAASTAEKVVSIPEITELNSGQVIVVSPTKSATVGNLTIKLNNFDAYPILYAGAAITTSTDSVVWNANQPSAFIFNGTNWLFLCHGLDSNTTYSTMSVLEGVTGTATSNRTLQAANLKQIIQGTTLTDLSIATASTVLATDSITDGIGKLQAQINALPSIPTNISAFTNDSGYITGITSSMVTTALGYTPYNSTNPSGYQANVIETIKVNNVAQTVTNKAVNITVPSAVTESTVSGWGFTKNTGTVTSVNNTQPDASGNVTISVTGGANTDLSNLSSTGEAHFQAPLVSGTSIKTINSTNLLGSGNIDTSEIFIATYGTTTYQEVLDAYNAGKLIYCIANTGDDDNVFILSEKALYNLYFISGNATYKKYVLRLASDNSWSTSSINFVNTDLSNLSTIGGLKLCGNITQKDAELYSGSLNGSTNLNRTTQITNYLPNDNYTYLVLVTADCDTGTTSGNYLKVSVNASANVVRICQARTRSSSSVMCGGGVWIPVDGTRKFEIVRNSNFNGTATISAIAYWRVM